MIARRRQQHSKWNAYLHSKLLLCCTLLYLMQQHPSMTNVTGQIIDIQPSATSPSPPTTIAPTVTPVMITPTTITPTASPTKFSIVLEPTIEPTTSIPPVPYEVTLPPHLRGPTIPTFQPTSKPQVDSNSPSTLPSYDENTNVPTTIPIADVITTPTVPTIATAPSTPTTRGEVVDSRDNNSLYMQILLPIISVISLILICIMIFVIRNKRRHTQQEKKDHVPVNDFSTSHNHTTTDYSHLFLNDMNSAFDDSSVYTSSIAANSMNNTKTSVTSGNQNNNRGTNGTNGGVNSIGGVIHNDLTEATIEDENEDDDDDDDDRYNHSTIDGDDTEDVDDEGEESNFMDDEETEDDDDDEYDDNDYDADGNHTLNSTLSDNRTRESNGNSNISSVTPNTLENLHIGYMEEGIMIQERYDRLNRELYSSERIAGTNHTSDANAIIRQAQALQVAKSMREASAAADAAAVTNFGSLHSTSDKENSPASEQSIEVTFRRDSLNYNKTAIHYDDIVGVDNNSATSYENSYDSSVRLNGSGSSKGGGIRDEKISIGVGVGTGQQQQRRMSSGVVGATSSSAKVLELLEAESPSSLDFDDSPGTTKRRNSMKPLQYNSGTAVDRNTAKAQPIQQHSGHNPLSSISLFKLGKGKKGPIVSRLNSKRIDTSNNVAQYKTDEPFPMTVPSVVLPSNSDDQNSSIVDPFSELTTDFHGDNDDDGSSDAHIVLESIMEGSKSTMDNSDGVNGSMALSSCDSSLNNTQIYETDTDSNASGSMRRGKKNSKKYDMNLPADYQPNRLNDYDDDGSANSKFDKLYESMSSEWEWKEPSQTIVPPATSTRNVIPSPKQQRRNSTNLSSDEVVRDLGNVFLV